MFINKRVKNTEWPEYLKNWYAARVQIITESPRTIGETLHNVNQPWRDHRGCKCAEVYTRMREHGFQQPLTEIEGHIFMIGREYTGPYQSVTKVCSKNVPRQNYGDVAYAWRRCYTQLQTDLWSQMEWMEGLKECTKRAQTKDVRFPTSKEVRSLKQLMEGLVIGPLDKNNGEMWMTCPELYDRALNIAYGREAGYKSICIPKVGRKI